LNINHRLGGNFSNANSKKFIEFSLQAIYDALKEISKTDQVKKILTIIGDG
jgi:chaperonin cofactor prefoldin